MLDQARAGFDTQTLSKNEIRKRLGAEELDDEGIESLLKEYESVQTPLMFSNAETLTDTRDTEVPIEETTIQANIQIAAEKLAEDVIKALGA
jgi:L-fucose isomerase-like protein